MRKMECIFVRKHIDLVNHEIGDKRTKNSRYLAIDQINPGCEWVFNGEGKPTIKWDGTAVLIQRDGGIAIAQKPDGVFGYEGDTMQVYQRYATKAEISESDMRMNGYILADTHPENGKKIYWVPCLDKWILEAAQSYFDRQIKLGEPIVEGTYEAIGPKINGNRYKADNHILVKHGWGRGNFEGMTLDYFGIKEFLSKFKLSVPEIYQDWVYHEGIVFHHPDGRMAKIRRADFGFHPDSEEFCASCAANGF